MWRAIGSVHSGEDKSVRSNRSRQQSRFENFNESLKKRSQLSPQMHRSFCEEYFQRRRNTHRDLTINERAKSDNKSEHSYINNNSNNNKKQDIFTSMRNGISKEDAILSKIQSKNDQVTVRNPSKNYQKTSRAVKQASTRLKTMKRQQAKFKQSINNEFNSFKNFFYQIQEMMRVDGESQKKQKSSSISEDPDFLKQILLEARSAQKMMMDLDKKKAAIMQKLSVYQ